MSEMIKIRDFSKGLYLGTPVDEIPQGALVRSRGIHPISQRSARSRFGTSLIYGINAHSIFRYKDLWCYGYGATFLVSSAATYISLTDSARLSASKMGPTAGIDDRLYVAGGGTLFKVDISTLLTSASYIWTISGSGTNEYYLTNADGGDPGISEPDAILLDSIGAPEGTAGGLLAGYWDWADNDALGFDTVYVRLSDGTDPDTKDDDYIKAVYLYDWGVTPPISTMVASDGGAGGELDDGAVYKYRITYYSSITGVRSNPSPEGSGAYPDAYTKLLLHCEGVDASTTFTDSSASNHTGTAQADAQIDTAQYKFGSASGLFDGTGDYVSFPDHPDWDMQSNEFTIEAWIRMSSVGRTNPIIQQYQDASNFAIFSVNSGNKLTFSITNSGFTVVYIVGATSLSVDTWYHVAAIRGWNGDPNRIAITINGNMNNYKTASGGWYNFAATLDIGKGSAAAYFAGWIDEVRISKGIARWTENFTVPTTPYGTPVIDLGGGSTSVDLTGIPESDDPQVDSVEIWRTAGGGSTYFLLTSIANGITTYTDNVSDDDLYALELPINNLKPYSWFDDCYGPYNASMFWITRTQTGEKGRLYYSSIGRAENVEGYINVTSDADPLQKIIGWRGYLGVLSQEGIYQILGTNPYQAKPVAGAPGTNSPHTAIVTPSGLVYYANDGVRLFDGSTSRLLNFDALSKVLRGISAGDLTSFDGVIAVYARGEYIISDLSQTLALRLEDLRWRDIGVGCNALAYAEDDDIIAASIRNAVVDLEDEGTTEDYYQTDITFTIEPGHVRLSEDKKVMLQNVHIDANANSETLSVYLIIDGLTVAEALALVNRITQTLGSELITNGVFDTDTDWSKGVGITITAGKAVFTAVADEVAIYQSDILVEGNFYGVEGTVSDWSEGSIAPAVTGGSYHGADGSFTDIIYADPGVTYLSFFAFDAVAGSTTLKLDDVSVKQITGVSFSNGSLSILLGTIDDAYRIVNTFPVGLLARIAGVRVTGSIDAAVELFGIDIEV